MTDDSGPASSDPGAGPSAPFADEGARYVRQGLIGRGGMGQVYAARDTRLRRPVALKIASTPELADRLAREAWITAQLEHPGIVAVYDAGTTDGQAWYTMRLIRGRTLRERLAACPDLAARLELVPHFHAACQAVAYAHAMGIVHRDLKPSNLMVGEFGETQVADWGLATPLDEARPDWQRIVGGGTPRYMSPEQASGAPPNVASDVYALGVALHELLGGRPDAPTADGLPPEAPRELVAIVRRCLRPDPTGRYPDAAALADDVGRWLGGHRVHAHAYRPTELLVRLVRAWRVPLSVAAVAAVALVLVVAAAVQRTARERATAEANLAVALTGQALAALLDARAPEAQILAAHALRYGPSPEARGILAATGRPVAALAQQVALPAACRHGGVLSPDAATLACRADGKLELWAVDPLAQRAVVDVQVVEDPVWVGDRLLVATPDALAWVRDGAVVASVAGPAWLPLAAGDAAFATRGPSARFLRPDGDVVAFPICSATRATTGVVGGALVVGCDDGTLRTYGPDGAPGLTVALGDRPAWSAVAAGPAGLLVGRLDGDVQTLSLPEGAVSAPLRGLSRSVRSLLAIPGSSAALVLGERGGPRIWTADGWAGSLPAGASRMFAGAAPGEVWLLGDTLQRWRVVATPTPTVFSFDAGVSQATPSPAGDAIAVALGSGEVVERRLADGRALRRWAWSGGVAKGVAYAAEDRLIGAAMGASAQRLGSDGVLGPVSPPATLRRLGRLADGRVWGLDYTGTAWVIAPDGSGTAQVVGPGPFDGSSSADGGTAAIVDARGGVWRLDGAVWREVARVTDATAVDVGDGGAPVVVGRRREVCVDTRCFDVGDEVTDVALFGARVAVATLSGDVVLLETARGATLARLRAHTERVSSVEFGPDGQWLVTGSWDKTARVWDLSALDAPAETLVARGEAAWGFGLADAMRGR